MIIMMVYFNDSIYTPEQMKEMLKKMKGQQN